MVNTNNDTARSRRAANRSAASNPTSENNTPELESEEHVDTEIDPATAPLAQDSQSNNDREDISLQSSGSARFTELTERMVALEAANEQATEMFRSFEEQLVNISSQLRPLEKAMEIVLQLKKRVDGIEEEIDLDSTEEEVKQMKEKKARLAAEMQSTKSVASHHSHSPPLLQEAEDIVNSMKPATVNRSPASLNLASIAGQDEAISLDDPDFLNTVQEDHIDNLDQDAMNQLFLMKKMELDTKATPKLKSTNPEKVAKYANDLRTNEKLLRSYGIPYGTITLGIDPSVLRAMEKEGVDIVRRRSVWSYLLRHRNEHMTSKRVHFLNVVDQKLSWKFKSSVPNSMRQFLEVVETLIDGIEMDVEQEKGLCLVTMKNLPNVFMKGAVKSVQLDNGWVTWLKIKKDLSERAQQLAQFNLEDIPTLSGSQKKTEITGNDHIPKEGIKTDKDPTDEAAKLNAKKAAARKAKGKERWAKFKERKKFLQVEKKKLEAEVKALTEAKNLATEEASALMTQAKPGNKRDNLLALLNSPIGDAKSIFEAKSGQKLYDGIVTEDKEDKFFGSDVIEFDVQTQQFLPQVNSVDLEDKVEAKVVQTDISEEPFESDNLAERCAAGAYAVDHIEELNQEMAEALEEHGYGDNVEQTLEPEEVQQEAKKAERNEIFDIFSTQLQDKVDSGDITQAQAEEYFASLVEYHQAFGLYQSLAQMSKLRPMQIRLKPGAKPMKIPPRPMNAIKKEAMRQKLRTLLLQGMIEEVHDVYCASPAFMVPKKNGKWRLVVDLRFLNTIVEVQVVNMPPVELQISWLPANLKFLAGLDNLSGFDLLRVCIDGQMYFGISTIFGTFLLKGAAMGFVNTPTVYQERMLSQILGTTGDNALFSRPGSGFLLWLDDSLAYADT